MKNSIKVAIIFLFVFVNFVYAEEGCNSRCCDEEYPKLIVMGYGKIETMADKAYFNVRIRVEEKKLQRAFELSTEKINSLSEILISYGIKKEDIRNLGYVYHPLYEGKKIFSTIDRPTSYEIIYTLRVTIYNLENLGKILTSLSEITETTVSGFEYTSTKIDELRRNALKEAASDAYQKAVKLAEGAHATLGRVVKIETGVSSYQQREYDFAEEGRLAFSKLKDETVITPTLESGYLQIEQDCTVYYAIQ
jgi:uncharacterized protein YggE